MPTKISKMEYQSLNMASSSETLSSETPSSEAASSEIPSSEIPFSKTPVSEQKRNKSWAGSAIYVAKTKLERIEKQWLKHLKVLTDKNEKEDEKLKKINEKLQKKNSYYRKKWW